MFKYEIVGYRRDGRPIWPILGAAPDDDEIEGGDEDPEDDEEDSDSEEDDSEEEDEKEKKPPAKKTPAKKASGDRLGASGKSALERERAARKNAERQLREVRRKNESDQDRIEREAEEAAAGRYKPAAIKAGARAALTEAKIKGDVTRAVRLINLDDCDVDEDGEIIGLDDQIARLKSDFPDMFETTTRRKIPRVDGAPRRPTKNEPKTSAEKIAAQYGMS